MTQLNRGIWLSAALSTVLFAVGCGGTTELDAGSGCTTDANCGTGKGCHPVHKTCVSTCTSGSDCPASEKTCAKIGNSTATFCTCATDALCGMAVPNNICNEATKQCTAKCTSNAGCPTGFTCSAAGNCTNGSSSDAGADAGTDAGMNTDAGVTCNNANQPDVCGYGNICDGNNACAALGDDRTCGNITASTRPAWTSASTGPVIYRVDDVMPDNAAACTTGNAFTVTIYAYAAAGSTFPAQKSNLPGFFYYNSAGVQTDIPTMLLLQSNYQLFANNTVMGATFTLCSTTATTSLIAGFGFTNGNSVCTTLTR